MRNTLILLALVAVSAVAQTKQSVMPAKTNLSASAPAPTLLRVTPASVKPEPKTPQQVPISSKTNEAGIKFDIPLHQVTLSWSYPSNQVSGDLSFTLSNTTNFSQPYTWSRVVAAPAGAFSRTFDGSNYIFSLTFSMPALQSVFVIQSSNWWGISAPQVIAVLPPAPLTITNAHVKQL